jgi:hypothetical protein
MKNTIKYIAAVTIAGTGLALACAGTAHADLGDELGFLYSLNRQGLYTEGQNQAGKLLAAGYWVCQARAAYSAIDLANFAYQHTDESVTWDQAAHIVSASHVYLCPVYLSTPVDVPGIAPAPAPSPLV